MQKLAQNPELAGSPKPIFHNTTTTQPKHKPTLALIRKHVCMIKYVKKSWESHQGISRYMIFNWVQDRNFETNDASQTHAPNTRKTIDRTDFRDPNNWYDAPLIILASGSDGWALFLKLEWGFEVEGSIWSKYCQFRGNEASKSPEPILDTRNDSNTFILTYQDRSDRLKPLGSDKRGRNEDEVEMAENTRFGHPSRDFAWPKQREPAAPQLLNWDGS